MRHKVTLLLCLVSVFCCLLKAQSPPACASTLIFQDQVAKGHRHPEAMDQMDLHLKELQLASNQRTTAVNQRYVIPVVYHIFHNGGQSEVPEQNIRQSLVDLNDAFANVDYYDPSTGVPIDISFCFARSDRYGLPTEGFEWINSPEFHVLDDFEKPEDMMRIYGWDPSKQLNIYSVTDVAFATAFATFPTSDPTELYDGVVTDFDQIGFDKDGGALLAHEVGHYLGLYHTFQEGCRNTDCLLQGDRVCDTPPDAVDVIYEGCTPHNNCTTDADDPSENNPFAEDVPDMNNNYMDYNFLNCMKAFTPGQRTRMRFALENFRPSLLTSTVCDSVTPTDDVELFSTRGYSDFYFDQSLEGDIRIRNLGSNNLTSLEIRRSLNEVPLDTVFWEGFVRAGGNLTWIEMPSIDLPEPGLHEFTVSIHSPNGRADARPQNNTLSHQFLRPHDGFLPYAEGFEEGIPEDWIVWDIPEDEWEVRPVSGCDQYGNQAMVVQNYFFQSPRFEVIYTPAFDLSLHPDAVFNFSHAFTRQVRLFNRPPLAINVIRKSDEGRTINDFWVSGYPLVAAIDYEHEGVWAPDRCKDWTDLSLDLSEYAGDKVFFGFLCGIGINDLERVYIDNVELTSTYAKEKEIIGVVEEDVRLYPIPTSDQLRCDFPVFSPTDFEIQIYSSAGQRVYTESQREFFGEYEGRYDFSGLSDGLYYFRLQIDDREMVRKFMIRK